MDFLGSTTPTQLGASVVTGVQDTGANLWPLLIFVGVPIAFIVASYLVSFIRSSVGRAKRA